MTNFLKWNVLTREWQAGIHGSLATRIPILSDMLKNPANRRETAGRDSVGGTPAEATDGRGPQKVAKDLVITRILEHLMNRVDRIKLLQAASPDAAVPAAIGGNRPADWLSPSGFFVHSSIGSHSAEDWSGCQRVFITGIG
jgi:hypothetical protein